MPQMLMIMQNRWQLLDKFEIDEIEVFVDITLYTFNFANVSRGLSSFHGQQTR